MRLTRELNKNNNISQNLKVLQAFNTLMEEGVITYEDGVITFNIDMVFKFKGELKIDCDEHVLISRGKNEDPNRKDGVNYSVWLNPSFDENNKPIALLEPGDECPI